MFCEDLWMNCANIVWSYTIHLTVIYCNHFNVDLFHMKEYFIVWLVNTRCDTVGRIYWNYFLLTPILNIHGRIIQLNNQKTLTFWTWSQVGQCTNWTNPLSCRLRRQRAGQRGVHRNRERDGSGGEAGCQEQQLHRPLLPVCGGKTHEWVIILFFLWYWISEQHI